MGGLFFSGIERRVAKVSIAVQTSNWPAVVAAVQKGCVVLRCEYRALDDAFHMDLLHPDFPILSIGASPGRYDAVLEETDEGIVRTGFKRR